VPWLEVEVDPPQVAIPLSDPQYITMDDPENDPSQLTYEYTADVTVTITQPREPTTEELGQYVRSDGQYRILLASTSTDSMVEDGSQRYGVQEGYGVRQLRFVPPSDEDAAATDTESGGGAPGPSALLVLAAVVVALGVIVRRPKT
jgi:hypothetical protein